MILFSAEVGKFFEGFPKSILQEESIDNDNDSESHPGQNLRNFLTKIGLTDLIQIIKDEMIDLDILKDMSHDDLKNVGVKAFGQRHRIIK